MKHTAYFPQVADQEAIIVMEMFYFVDLLFPGLKYCRPKVHLVLNTTGQGFIWFVTLPVKN